MAVTPALGYGQRGEASIDSVNQWMRGQPWYQQLLASWGQSPNDVHLSDTQKQQVIRAAQANGVVVDEGGDGQEVDDSGNFRAKGHKLRNTLIVAGIAGAALLTAGAAGAFAGGAGMAGGAGGVEAGAAAGLGSAASSGAALGGMASLPALGTIGEAAAGVGAAGAGATAAGAGAFDAAGNFVGPSTVSSVGGPTGAGGMSIPWGDVIRGGTQLFGNLFAGQQQIAGADRAAQLMADASKYSADQIAKANADSLTFQKGSAENAFLNNEAARSGNYGVFAARERRLGSIGEEVGLGPREIPAYVPGVDPMFGGGGGSSSSGSPTNTSSDADIAAAVTKNYQALGFQPTGPGSGPTDAAYMAQKIKETGGLTPGNTSYWFGPGGRIADEITKAGLVRR